MQFPQRNYLNYSRADANPQSTLIEGNHAYYTRNVNYDKHIVELDSDGV
jgi:hypothetical protein